MSSKGCGGFDPIGSTPAFIYPDEGIANVYTVTNGCPIKVSDAVTVSSSVLAGWICLPPDQAAKYRREFEKQCEQ